MAGVYAENDNVEKITKIVEKFRVDQKKTLKSNNFFPANSIQSSVKPLSESATQLFEQNKSLKLNEFLKKGNKPSISLLICGHVDAGKSTLLGHLIYLLGFAIKSEIHKIKKEINTVPSENNASINYSWLLDNSSIERNRGVTVHVGSRNFQTDNRRVTALDCPGHKDFVPHLLTEAFFADAALLVVDCSPSNFENGFAADGQCKEHAVLARSLGVARIIVALNKMDSFGWSKTRADQVKTQLDHFLKHIKFKRIAYVPVSALKGGNLTTNTHCDWYDGSPLAQTIDSIKPPSRSLKDPARFCIMSVDQSFGHGKVAYGKLVCGSLLLGQRLLVMPVNFLVKVKSICVDGDEREIALAGESAEVGFGSEKGVLRPGQVACDCNCPISVVAKFEAKVRTLNIRRPLIVGRRLQLFVNSDSSHCSVARIKETQNDGRETVNRRPKCVPAKTSAVLVLESERAICAEAYDRCRRLSRIVLRSEGHTIAVGVICHLIE